MVLDFDAELEMLLFDQSQIVTYKQLTEKFKLRPFEAKRKLQSFLDKKSNENNGKEDSQQIYATYVVIAEDESTGKKHIQLVNDQDDKDDENTEKKKSWTILSKSIYSLQTKKITDFNLLYSCDVDVSRNWEDRRANLDVIYKPVTSRSEPILPPLSKVVASSQISKQEKSQQQQQQQQLGDVTNYKKKEKMKEESSKSAAAKVEVNSAEDEDMMELAMMNAESSVSSKSKNSVVNVKKEPTTSSSSSNTNETSKANNEPAMKKVKAESSDSSKVPHSAVAAKGKKIPPKAQNQQSMMNFFKKK